MVPHWSLRRSCRLLHALSHYVVEVSGMDVIWDDICLVFQTSPGVQSDIESKLLPLSIAFGIAFQVLLCDNLLSAYPS
jgi:hypothetical protein